MIYMHGVTCKSPTLLHHSPPWRKVDLDLVLQSSNFHSVVQNESLTTLESTTPFCLHCWLWESTPHGSSPPPPAPRLREFTPPGSSPPGPSPAGVHPSWVLSPRPLGCGSPPLLGPLPPAPRLRESTPPGSSLPLAPRLREYTPPGSSLPLAPRLREYTPPGSSRSGLTLANPPVCWSLSVLSPFQATNHRAPSGDERERRPQPRAWYPVGTNSPRVIASFAPAPTNRTGESQLYTCKTVPGPQPCRGHGDGPRSR